LSFKEAKIKAQNEIFKIFELGEDLNGNSEYLNISDNEEINQKLLAISLILLGNRQLSPELTEFLTNIKIDIKTDGVLNSTSLKSELITSAILLNIGL